MTENNEIAVVVPIKIVIFKSKIYQWDGVIDAKQLFEDIEKFIAEQKARLGVTKLDRRHPLQKVINRTSGGYVSSTAMKSYELCAGGYLVSQLAPPRTGTATSIGSTVHEIFDLWYKEEVRSKEKLYEITERIIDQDKQEESRDIVYIYVNGYYHSPDYLSKDLKPMDHQKLVCSGEVFIKPTIAPFGVDLGPVYELIDRIDIRDDGIYSIDYKTGLGDPTNNYIINSYLAQMIFAKWAIEAEYGQPVKKSYLCLPGADSQEFKYIEMNVNSLVEQSKVVDSTMAYLKEIRAAKEVRQYPCKLMRYCGSCFIKSNCATYIKAKGLDESQIKEEIEIVIEVEEPDLEAVATQ